MTCCTQRSRINVSLCFAGHSNNQVGCRRVSGLPCPKTTGWDQHLVFYSGCRTGRSRFIEGDGYADLQGRLLSHLEASSSLSCTHQVGREQSASLADQGHENSNRKRLSKGARTGPRAVRPEPKSSEPLLMTFYDRNVPEEPINHESAHPPPPSSLNFQMLLRSYCKARGDIQTWSDFFLAQEGRRPQMKDVDSTRIPWLCARFREYVQIRDLLESAALDPGRAAAYLKVQRKFFHLPADSVDTYEAPAKTWHSSADASIQDSCDDAVARLLCEGVESEKVTYRKPYLASRKGDKDVEHRGETEDHGLIGPGGVCSSESRPASAKLDAGMEGDCLGDLGAATVLKHTFGGIGFDSMERLGGKEVRLLEKDSIFSWHEVSNWHGLYDFL